MKHAFLYYNAQTNKFIVQIASCIDWAITDQRWQNSPIIGTKPYVPDVDIEESTHIFDNLEDAERKIAKHYARQWQIIEQEKNVNRINDLENKLNQLLQEVDLIRSTFK